MLNYFHYWTVPQPQLAANQAASTQVLTVRALSNVTPSGFKNIEKNRDTKAGETNRIQKFDDPEK